MVNRKQLDALTRALRAIRKQITDDERRAFDITVDALVGVLVAYNANFNAQRFRDEVYG